MGEYKVANVGGGVVIQNAHENIVAVVGDLARADYYAKVLNAETAPLHERIAELEAAMRKIKNVAYTNQGARITRIRQLIVELEKAGGNE
jgi:hypothetical protein